MRRKPGKIVTARSHDHIDDSVQVGGRYIGFGIWPRLFVADTKTHRYVQIGRHGGWVQVDDTTLLVAFGSPTKVIHPRFTSRSSRSASCRRYPPAPRTGIE